jgi:glycogen synthase
MHICLVSTQYPPETNYGGIATYVSTIAHALSRRGHTVSVVSVSHSGNPGISKDGLVAVWRLAEKGSRKTLKEHLKHNRQVMNTVNQIKPDIVQFVDYQAEGFLLSQLNRHKYGVVTRIADHATLTKLKREKGINLREEFLGWMAKRQLAKSHAVIAPSAYFARMVEREVGLKAGSIRHIYNGLDMQEMAYYAKTEPIIKLEEPYIIFFGRLEERKGVQYLARALPPIWEKMPYLKVVFAGQYSGFTLEKKPSRYFVEEIAGKKYRANLIFTDHLPREKVLPLVAGAKLAVLPSLWEAFGFTCAEALALGVPVVTTLDSGGLTEIVGGYGDTELEPGSVPAGWLVPRADSWAISRVVLEAFTDYNILREVKEKVKLRAQSFDVEKSVGKLETIYQTVCSR